LKILKTKPIDFIRIKSHLDISIMYPLGKNKLMNKKKVILKGPLKTRFNFDISKVHNYHLVKVSQKTISHLISLLARCDQVHLVFHSYLSELRQINYRPIMVKQLNCRLIPQ
jgi:hypothetical protein